MASFDIGVIEILSIVLPIVFVLISLLIWFKYGKDDPVIETVEFYPPAGFNSAEVGFLYKGRADNNEVVSLLIYLANKGYLKICETVERNLFSKVKGFKLTKLKEYDGNNENERLFLEGLFSPSAALNIKRFLSQRYNPQGVEEEVHTELSEVTSEDLYDYFYETLNAIISNLNNEENERRIFEESSSGKGFYLVLMNIVTFLLITIKPVLDCSSPLVEGSGSVILPFALLFPGIGFTILLRMVFGNTYISTKIFGLLFGIIFGGVPWGILVLPALLVEPIYLVANIIGYVSIFVIVVLLKLMPKRTPYGNEILGRIRGFKTFVETAEKPRLEAMVMENPTYFYDILPYTYVLGVSDTWIKKFETISLCAPYWYDGSPSFDAASFGSFINSTMYTASKAMGSCPTIDTGGPD